MNNENVKLNKIRYLLVMSLFGCLGPIVRAIGFPSAVIACLRAWIAALSLVLYLLITKHRYDKKSFLQVLKPMLPCGVLIACDWIGLFTSYNYTTIATATVCYYVVPVLVFIASPIVLHEHFALKHAFCAGIAFIGMIFVSGVIGVTSDASADLKGICFALLGAVSYASVILINKRYPEGDPILRTTIQLCVAAIVTTPYILLTTAPETLVFTWQSILLLLVLGIGLTAIAYILYFYLIVRIPARSVAIFSYADPVVAVIISLCFLNEPITLWGILGSVLIIGSAFISEF